MLASIENDIWNVSVMEGEMALFTCAFSKGDISDIDIDWIFNGDQYDECVSIEEDIAPDGNGCYTNDTHSVLVLKNTDSLAVGSYQIQCILQQNISDSLFLNDPSFQQRFHNDTVESAFLVIYSEPVGKSHLYTTTHTRTRTRILFMPLLHL